MSNIHGPYEYVLVYETFQEYDTSNFDTYFCSYILDPFISRSVYLRINP